MVVGWPQIDLCPGSWPGTLMGAGQLWHLLPAHPYSPSLQLAAQPMGTCLGGGVAEQPVPFPVQLPPVGQMLSEAAVSGLHWSPAPSQD